MSLLRRLLPALLVACLLFSLPWFAAAQQPPPGPPPAQPPPAQPVDPTPEPPTPEPPTPEPPTPEPPTPVPPTPVPPTPVPPTPVPPTPVPPTPVPPTPVPPTGGGTQPQQPAPPTAVPDAAVTATPTRRPAAAPTITPTPLGWVTSNDRNLLFQVLNPSRRVTMVCLHTPGQENDGQILMAHSLDSGVIITATVDLTDVTPDAEPLLLLVIGPLRLYLLPTGQLRLSAAIGGNPNGFQEDFDLTTCQAAANEYFRFGQ